MSAQSPSSRFRALFGSALLDYETRTGINLLIHPLAKQLRNCRSAEDIAILLQEHARALDSFQGSDSIESIASDLSMLSITIAIGDSIGQLFLPAEVMHTSILVLLSTAKGMSASYYALVDLLKLIKRFFEWLEIYTEISPTPAMDEIVVNIMVELLSTLALATTDLQQGRPMRGVKRFLGEREVEAILQRLDRLSQDEARMTALQILEVVYGLVDNMRLVMDDGMASINKVWDTLEILHQTASDINKSKRDRLQRDVRSWLSSPDPWRNHKIACELRHPGTGAWFVQGSTFSKWKWSGSTSLLWIHGKPGAGKSVLCSTIIEDIGAMKKRGLASLAFFYHDFREDQMKNPCGLLSSVLFQLCDQTDSYYNILSKFYLKHISASGSQRPSDDELFRCLRDILILPGQAPVFLIVDALEECPTTYCMPSTITKILRLVEEFIELRLPNLRVCVTSRFDLNIRNDLEHLASFSLSLHNESGQQRDIEKYIKSVVNTNIKMHRWKQGLKQLVITVLTRMADRTFRWVYCQLDYLSNCIPRRILHALETLPETLDESYERILRDLDDADWEVTHRLLQCVIAASRPLRVQELAQLFSFDFEAGPIPVFREDWRLEDPVEAVLSTRSALLALVNVDDSPVIQLSHHSVKEFLASNYMAENRNMISHLYHFSMAPAHTLVAQACLGILLHLDESRASDTLQKFPLAEYAAKHWTDHARFGGVSQNIKEGMKKLFDRSRPHLALWIWTFDPIEHCSRSQLGERPSPPRGTPLHYAAFCGLNSVVQFLAIEHPEDVNCQSLDNESTPLHLALGEGHVASALLLLDHGADPTVQDRHGWTPLYMALSDGRVELVRILLGHRPSATAQNQDESTSLHQASSMGKVDVVRGLLERGADVTTKDRHGLTPLHLASGGHVQLAQLLLEYRVDPAAHDREGWTPLHLASSGGHIQLSRILLRHGADGTAKDQNKWTPLHRASSRGYSDIVRILLEHNADAGARDNENCSPLHRASEHGHLRAIRLLLEHDAQVDVKDHNGRTPLHWASRNGHLEIVQVLCERGADMDAKDHGNSTPLHEASQGGHLTVVKVLLEQGANALALDYGGWSPLQLSSQRGHLKTVRLLLQHGVDANTRDNSSWTSLHSASQHGHLEVVRALLGHGADANSRDDSDWTPLYSALQREHHEVVQVLLEHGANANSRDKNNRNLLYAASQHGHHEVVQVLLEHGADANSREENNRTLLHVASQYGHYKVVRSLLEHGADANSRDDSNWTPLHAALQQEHYGVVRILLDQGADACSQDEKNRICLHMVSQRGHHEVVQVLLEHGADANSREKNNRTPLHTATQHGHYKVVQVLLEHGADANSRDDSNWTPLHAALQQENYGIIRVLLERGADASSQDENNRALLHVVSQRGRHDVVRVLLEHGADANSREKNNRTLLHSASQHGHSKVVQVLLEHGADANSRDDSNWTPLHAALQQEHYEVVRILLIHGANANSQDENNRTPLHVVSQRGLYVIVQVLLDHGANANSREKNNRTPLHAASQHGHYDVVRALLKHGASPNSQDGSDWTPLHDASQEGHDQVVRILLEYRADANSRNSNNETPLHLASRAGSYSSVALLVKHTAGINARNNKGLTALLEAQVRSYHSEIIQLLRSHGAKE